MKTNRKGRTPLPKRWIIGCSSKDSGPREVRIGRVMDRRAYRWAGNVEREPGGVNGYLAVRPMSIPANIPTQVARQGTGLHSKQWPIRRSTLARLPEQPRT